MTLDLRWNAEQRAIADAIAKLCRDRATGDAVRATAGRFPRELWSALADLGFLGLATPEGGGGALEVVAACEALGRHVFPGPVCETFLATQALDGAERDTVASGAAIVSVGAPPLMPWARDAQLFLEIAEDRLYRARVSGPVEALETLGGEPWGRVALERMGEIPNGPRALALYDAALAAYVAAAGAALVASAAEHARGRVQFGKPIGRFQAVAHPLADCSMRLAAAAALARAAAFDLDGQSLDRAAARAAAARLSSRGAALEAAHVCHQVFGALGITLEGPVFHVSRRIRQLASAAPGVAPARRRVLSSFGVEP